jgi:hypothetical protein
MHVLPLVRHLKRIPAQNKNKMNKMKQQKAKMNEMKK